MKLLVISGAPFIFKGKKSFAYSPYVKELIVWEKYVEDILFCCPVWKNENGLLIEEIPFHFRKHYKLIDFNLNSFPNIIKSFFLVFCNILIIIKAVYDADHIHLRCPGNMGLLGCIVQIFFPSKKKTAKYAGNWDPRSKQPLTYRMQKWILNNTFLTRNMQVLVYGEWENQSKNIKSFFTATYSESEKEVVAKDNISKEKTFVFVGALASGKNPMYAIKLVEQLVKNNNMDLLHIFGEGRERVNLENYIKENQLEKFVFLHGNQNKETLKQFYKKSHFVILPSKSEGWPKAIAEGMFWGCVPLATNVSCVPFMINYGERGLLLDMNVKRDVAQIQEILSDQNRFEEMSKLASEWSRNYTTDIFEKEIKNLLVK
ncbi:glycosyltransferase [Flavobacterium sp. TR2]|uniref:glycosyltransferase n=1 Tax=Flavobacterium sp. TR2 TaxID=2977321 RepID=UPI0021B09929|nr:glycosyltransferase [Flavobacterium sp. TR2]UWY28594.1 glycosyltransferase [Flavobacterium sp. TR2]